MNDERTPTGRERAHDEFVQPGPLPEGANLADAEARLLGVLEREVGVGLGPARPVARRRWLLPLAATVIGVAGLLWTADALRRPREGALLRGTPPQVEAPGGWAARPHATSLPGDRVELAWSAADGATGYAVTFLTPDLEEVARVDSLAAPRLVLDAAHLPAGLTPHARVLWRVAARAGNDELSRSPTVPLTLP